MDYQSQIYEKGAHSTLAGAIFIPRDQQIQLQMATIGDAEIFVVQSLEDLWHIHVAYSLQKVRDFTNFPETLSTIDSSLALEEAWAKLQRRIMIVDHSDVVILMTDSLAKWTLADADARMTHLLGITSVAAFEEFVAKEQAGNRLDLDDITMVVIPVAQVVEHLEGRNR